MYAVVQDSDAGRGEDDAGRILSVQGGGVPLELDATFVAAFDAIADFGRAVCKHAGGKWLPA